MSRISTISGRKELWNNQELEGSTNFFEKWIMAAISQDYNDPSKRTTVILKFMNSFVTAENHDQSKAMLTLTEENLALP